MHVLERLRPTSTFGRAVLPVVGGIAFFVVLGLATWGVAALLSGNPEQVEERLAPPTWTVGRTEFLAGEIAEDGPLLFQGLLGDTADRSIVLDHQGDDPRTGWRVRYAFPADRDDTCKVRQVPGSREFLDCEGRTLGVDDLARPERVRPLVSDVVIIDLRGAAEDAASATSSGTEP